ncbi:MAG: NADH-quinone oxidoreductase subunit A [Acidobacteriaceae bacterium]
MHTPNYFWNYLPLLIHILIVLGMGVAMVTGSFFIGRHRRTSAKLAAYECGIIAEGDARGRFSVRFYMVAMLFILFDVEVVFMLPWAVIYRQLPAITGSRMFGFWEMLVYLGFVFVGFFYIVNKGVLNWAAETSASHNGSAQRAIPEKSAR